MMWTDSIQRHEHNNPLAYNNKKDVQMYVRDKVNYRQEFSTL